MVWRFWKSRAAAVAFLAAALSSPGCRGRKPGEAQEVTPELQLTGVRFRVYRGDTLRASGESARVSLRRDSTELLARELAVALPPERRSEGDPVVVTAPRGHGIARDRKFSAYGGVTVARGQDVARTESARFDPTPAGGVVRSETPVVVEGEGYRLSGPGFELDPKQGTIVIHGGAHLDAARAGARRP
jgi:lipopolysaccharide export system protein LptC